MSKTREASVDTRDRLLEAAGDLFSRQGFRRTTVAQVCARARANIAAVNYHFGGKRELYLAAWKRAFDEAIHVYPFDGGVGEDEPPEARLAGIIDSALRRFLDEGRLGRWSKLLIMEMAQPTGILGDARHKAMRPLAEAVDRLMLELLGEGATETDAMLCGMSVVAQVIGMSLHTRLGPPRIRRKFPGPSEIELLSEHITRFALGGINAGREQIRRRAKDDRA